MDQQVDKDVLWGNILRGHVETMILKVLQDGDYYGYAICRNISDHTDGAFDLKEATLYACLRRMEKEGKVNSYWGDESQGSRRKYYAVTDRGREAYHNQKKEWQEAVKILQKLI